MALHPGSVPRPRTERTPAERLAKLEDRYRHELMDPEQRCELQDRIRKLKNKAGAQ